VSDRKQTKLLMFSSLLFCFSFEENKKSKRIPTDRTMMNANVVFFTIRYSSCIDTLQWILKTKKFELNRIDQLYSTYALHTSQYMN
jgi:hypothetical protein